MKRRGLVGTFLVLVSLVAIALPLYGQFSLIKVGSTNNGGIANDIAVSGHYAYLANDTNGLRVYDVSNPADPVNVCHTNAHNQQAMKVVISGERGYVVDYSGFGIYDVSDPTNVFNVTYVYGSGTTYDIAVVGNFAYVACSSSLNIFDVSNPTNVVFRGSVTNREAATNYMRQWWRLTVSGDCAYLGGGGMDIVNVSNPAEPLKVGRSASVHFLSDLAISSNYVYAASVAVPSPGGGLHVYDVSSPTNPVIAFFSNTQVSASVAASSHFVFLGEYPKPVLYDVSNPTNPVVVAYVNPAELIYYGSAISDNYIYTAGYSNGLSIYLITPQPSIELTDTNSVCVSWAEPPAPGIVLQQNTDLGTTNWLDVTNTPVVVSNRNEVVLPMSDGSAFYRLKHQ